MSRTVALCLTLLLPAATGTSGATGAPDGADGADAHVPAGPPASTVGLPAMTRAPRSAVVGQAAPPADTAAFPVRAARGLQGLALSLARDPRARAPLPGIGPPLEVLSPPPVLWLVRDLREVPGRRPAVEEDWVAGFADFGANLVALRAEGPGTDPAGLLRTFRHELAHLALHRATGGAAPRWLHEGYAQLVVGEWDWRRAWQLRWKLLHQGEILRGLSLDFPRREAEARTAYLLSYTAVHRLYRSGGGAALASFFDLLRRSGDLDQAMRATYGVTLDQFEDRWKQEVGDRYGWLYLLSRASLFWLAVTLLVIVAGWRRWRYNRRRMRELKRRERETAERWADRPDPRPLRPWEVPGQGHVDADEG